MTVLYIMIAFSLGFAAGSWLRGNTFDNLDWRCLKWNPDSFGYRPVPDGTKIHRGDKVMMGLPIDPGHWPEEGVAWGEDPI